MLTTEPATDHANDNNQTCDLCKHPTNVGVCRDNVDNIMCYEICATTISMHVDMFNRTYVRALRVCHACCQQVPGSSQKEADLYARLAVENYQIATLYQSFPFPDNVAIRITDYVFALATKPWGVGV